MAAGVLRIGGRARAHPLTRNRSRRLYAFAGGPLRDHDLVLEHCVIGVGDVLPRAYACCSRSVRPCCCPRSAVAYGHIAESTLWLSSFDIIITGVLENIGNEKTTSMPLAVRLT
jgi:hypothetical protein